ncbi:MAG TPA: hypothetical protein DCM54_00760 [Gammaproteobacteria bacterium]|nr:hypothetical protein [Gammaproteobacteria bacterium]|tara:strand:+ start:133 stop:2145 length:2013 start_codon:yes stop_codon:yes gene_type:complete
MDNFIFAKVRDYLLLLGQSEDPTAVIDFFAEGEELFNEPNASNTDLAEVLPNQNLPHKLYDITNNDDFLLLTPDTRLLGKKSAIQSAENEAKERVTEFHLANKTRLISALYAESTSLPEYVKAWSEYFFCDHFSLWIYNKYTKAFTRATGSFESPQSYIFEHEDSTLNDALLDSYSIECRAPREPFPNGLKTVNRIKLTLGYDGTVGLLSFYSRHSDYRIEPSSCDEVRNSIETKYLQVRQQAHQAMDQINQQFIGAYEAGKLDEFLHSMVCQVKQSFQCEACSIFVADDAQQNLSLVATCDSELHGRPDREYSYQVDSGKPTTDVYLNQRIAFSYDLSVDDPDNVGYNEQTEHPPTNWIGAPLISAGRCLGVFRVRNKYEEVDGKQSIINFRSGDFMNLLSLCSNLGNLIRIESLFNETERKLAETNANIIEMNDFNKVFLHEIRTPISKFTMAPEIIKRTLARPEISPENLERVIRQLDDIQVMGDRLEFIAKTFNFNQIVTRRDFKILSVLRDIIFPVINITRAYLRKQYDRDIDLDTTGLNSIRVYGDKTLLNICFNTLIDNAGKYSVGTRKPIDVSGGYHDSGDFFDVVVSNYGLPILEEERERLLENGVRGTEAVRQGIGGTGIGLHLAQRIMHEGKGDLLLTSIKDPVSFTLRIPVRPQERDT